MKIHKNEIREFWDEGNFHDCKTNFGSIVSLSYKENNSLRHQATKYPYWSLDTNCEGSWLWISKSVFCAIESTDSRDRDSMVLSSWSTFGIGWVLSWSGYLACWLHHCWAHTEEAFVQRRLRGGSDFQDILSVWNTLRKLNGRDAVLQKLQEVIS